MEPAKRRTLLIFLQLCIFWIQTSAQEEETFDVRQHLSTVTRYGAVNATSDSFVPSTIPNGCTPIHLNLVGRHGARLPTKRRMKALDDLAIRLQLLLKEAKTPSSKVPSWMWGWESPWKGKENGGELITGGEEEVYNLGLRTRARFPDLFSEDYHPSVFPIRATQIPRAAASAVAFGMGLFRGTGDLGVDHDRAFSVVSESRASDIVLRFQDCCQNYKDFKEKQKPAVDKMKEPILDEITSSLSMRYDLNFTQQDTASLWFLCKQEASLLDITDQACGLFSHFEVAMMEWTDDLGVFILKGYGQSLNYQMGVPLLQDVFQAMEQAINATEDGHPPGSYEKARLRFAHAETVVPFSCLLGLFVEGAGREFCCILAAPLPIPFSWDGFVKLNRGVITLIPFSRMKFTLNNTFLDCLFALLNVSDFIKIQKEQHFEPPPKPPKRRNWKVSAMAPFAGNSMLVLHKCPAEPLNKYYVQILHNEQPIPLPGCDTSDFCPFETFKENIVAPHLKHDFDAVCNGKLEVSKSNPASKWSRLVSWLFPLKNNVSATADSSV